MGGGAARKLSANSKGEARELLMRLQAAYAELGSWLSDELGDRNTGQFWIDRALEWSHETADDPDGAVHAGQKALDIAARTGSARILTELAPLPAALAAWHDSGPVKKFSADLIDALPSRDGRY
jgi:hypothetical protein